MNFKTITTILASCVFLSLSLCAADSTDTPNTNETQEVATKPVHVTWGEEAFFKKTWPDAVLYCAEKNQRLPLYEEIDTLPQNKNDIWSANLTYIKAQSPDKQTICVVDTNTSFIQKLQREDIQQIRFACGYDDSAHKIKEEQFSAKSTGLS